MSSLLINSPVGVSSGSAVSDRNHHWRELNSDELARSIGHQPFAIFHPHPFIPHPPSFQELLSVFRLLLLKILCDWNRG